MVRALVVALTSAISFALSGTLCRGRGAGRATAFTLVLVSAVSARADSLKTEVLFLKERGMGAERALTLYDRVIGRSGESSALVGRQPNMLVVRDTPERLARFRSLIRLLDVEGDERRLYVRPIVHLPPSALIALIGDLIPQAVRLFPDDRTNNLVVSASLTDYRRLDTLIRKLDVAGEDREHRAIRVTPQPSEGGFPP